MPPKYELDGGNDLNKIADQLERMTGTDGDELLVRSDSEKISDDAEGVSLDAPARQERKAAKSTPIWVNILLGVAVLAVLASGALVVLNWANRQTATAKVAVPDLIGLTPADADAKLREVDLKVRVSYDPASTQPDGTLLSTTPAAGAMLAKGEVVTLLVAKKGATVKPGPDPGPGPQNPVPPPATKLTVPDVDAKARTQAEADIKKAGLTPKIDFSRTDTDLPKDTVIMTDPAKGTEVQRGTTVTLYVNSKGEDTSPTPVIPLSVVITLKDYAGLPAATVEKELRDLGLAPKLEYQVTRVQAPQHVISTTPPAGTQVSPKATIVVMVARQ